MLVSMCTSIGRAMHCPSFDHKPALMRAYHAADVSHDGFIERSEFRKLLRYLVYFNNLWQKFDEIDNDHDRRLDVDEFAHGCGVLGIELSPKQARAEFARCDADGAGMVLFGEFCKWAADRHIDADAASIQERSEQEAGAAIRSRDKAEAARSVRATHMLRQLERLTNCCCSAASALAVTSGRRSEQLARAHTDTHRKETTGARGASRGHGSQAKAGGDVTRVSGD